MAYMLIGEAAHEWMGAAMFVLFLLHHVLNWRWYRNLVKGKYTALRILQTVVDFLVLLAMIGLMVSGIMLSRECSPSCRFAAEWASRGFCICWLPTGALF